MTSSTSIDFDIAQIQRTLRATEAQLSQLGSSHEPALANALLILAVQRMIQRDGVAPTATVLCRLADAVRTGPAPPADRAIDLTALNS